LQVHAERAGWSPTEIARATAEKGQALPCIEFVTEAEQCPVCGSPLAIQKSRERQVATLEAGVFTAREVLKHCAREPSHPVLGAAALSRRVRPRQRYGYDVIVHVGLARYLRGKQRGEIQAELYRARGIRLSEGSVSNLCDRFLCYLEALHLARVPALRRALQEGYPLHIDATCEYGKGGLFVCMDGWRDWVLLAARVPSEHEDHLRPLVEETTTLFGAPIAIVRDLGEGGARAVASLRAQGIPDLVCHYHFLGAVGNKLFDQPYALLRRILRHSKVRSDLRTLLRELRQYRKGSAFTGRFGSGSVREDLQALVLWLLEGEGRKDLVYPFSLPHLGFFQRCQQATQKLERWVPTPRTVPERRAIVHLGTLINRFERDPRFAIAVPRLEKGWQAFCELRDVLQLTHAELPTGEVRAHQSSLPALDASRLQAIEKAVEAYRAELGERVGISANASSTTPSPAAVILKYFKRYGERLFGHPTRRDDQGIIQAVVERTNNVPEHFFGRQKQRLRRRLGRAHLGRDLEDQPAQAALAANLDHPDYVRVLCGSLENLAAAFADLDEQVLAQAGPLSRSNRDTALFRRVRDLLKQQDMCDIDHNSEREEPRIELSATVV